MTETRDPASPAPAACPNCGADAQPDQLFCLECGERLSLGYRRPSRWQVPAAILAGVVLLAGAAAAYALVAVTDESEQVAGPPVQPPATAPQGTGESENTEEEEETTPAPEEEGSGAEIREWPADTSAYTVILLSTDSASSARPVAAQAAQAGIPAGVLDSSEYSSLNPGFQVVFAGEFDTIEEAQQESERYAGLGFPGGYPRFVNGGD